MQEILREVKLGSDLITAIGAGHVTVQWHQQGPPYKLDFVQQDGVVVKSLETLIAPPSTLFSSTNTSAAHDVSSSTTSASPIPPAATSTSSASNVDVSENDIISTIAKHLAKQLQPVTLMSLAARVSAENPAASKELVQSTLQRVFADVTTATAKPSSSMVDMPPSLVTLVQPEWYADSAVDRKRAANKIARLLHRQRLSFSAWERFVDRDVFMELHSDGGIMGGMASAPSASTASAKETDEEYEASERRPREEGSGAGKGVQKRRRIERMKDLDGISWTGAGNLLLHEDAFPSSREDDARRAIDAYLTLRKQEEQQSITIRAAVAGRGGSPIPQLHCGRSPSEVLAFRDSIADMVRWVTDIEARLSAHEVACAQLRQVVQEQQQLAESNSAPSAAIADTSFFPLAKEIELWLQPQIPIRQRLYALLQKLRFEISHRLREDNDASWIDALVKEYSC